MTTHARNKQRAGAAVALVAKLGEAHGDGGHDPALGTALPPSLCPFCGRKRRKRHVSLQTDGCFLQFFVFKKASV